MKIPLLQSSNENTLLVNLNWGINTVSGFHAVFISPITKLTGAFIGNSSVIGKIGPEAEWGEIK